KIWTVAETPIHPKNSSSGIFSLAFANAKDGIAGGGDYQSPERSEVPNVLRTRDGGRTWQAFSPTHPPGIYFSSVALQHHRIMAAGIKGIWIHPERPRGRADIWRQASTENLNTLGVANHEIWAVGPKGVVLKLSEP
ncbi:MAG TPA: hypothetical protein VFY05_11595, partial [Candidatus Angelobacter sp.]|nr:hypothetical protein [Candidatus Angelobacter sp.]